MGGLVINGDTSGSVTLQAPAVAGSSVLTLPAGSGPLTPLVSGTAVTASGTVVDFTGIPSWVKRITVMFDGISTNGTSNLLVQIGDSGGVETTGYTGATTLSAASSIGTINSTTGVNFNTGLDAATTIRNGLLQICNLNGNVWVFHGMLGSSDTARAAIVGYSKTLSATLDRIRITTVNGTDTFDAGTINIMYE